MSTIFFMEHAYPVSGLAMKCMFCVILSSEDRVMCTKVMCIHLVNQTPPVRSPFVLLAIYECRTNHKGTCTIFCLNTMRTNGEMLQLISWRWFETLSVQSQKHGGVYGTYVDAHVTLNAQFCVLRAVTSD